MNLKINNILKKYSYKDSPLLFKISFSFVILFLLMIIISFTTFIFYKEDKYKSTLSMVTQINSQAVSKTDSYIQSITDLTKTPLFYKNTIRSLYLSNTNSYEFLNIQKDLNSIIDNIFSLNKSIHSVFIFNLNGESYYTVQGGYIRSNYYPEKEAWFKKCITKFGTPVNIPTFTLPNSYSNNFKSPYVFSTARALFSYDDSSVAGVILINSSVDVLASTVSNMLVYPGQRVIIANKSGYVIYDTDGTEITAPLDSSLRTKLLSPKYTSKNVDLNGTNCLVTKEYSNLTDWQIINIIPNDSLNRNITDMSLRVALLTSFIILIACLLIFAIYKQVINSLRKLSAVMKIVEKGNFDVKVPVESNDEVGRLSKTFNSMTAKIKELIDEVYVDKINQKDLELRMLQNQINPHFIYNTLESIHMMAEINDDNETSEMAVNFGKILRYGLTSKERIVTIKDEIDNIEAYLMLIKTRYDNIQDIIIDIDASLYDKQIIKLVFQPIVENSIYHGLSTLESGGTITIKGYTDNNLILFDIIDNGIGMDSAQVTSLNGYINDLNEDFKSIGLKNVNMRVKLYYGETYGITILSTMNEGTTVRIVIPFI